MSVARTKILETAQKFLARGQYDRAIAEYHRLVQQDPTDVRTWLKIGDLYTRKGSRREACDTYARVAEQYAQQGFFLKSVAVYKQILKLDANRVDATKRLAEMYEQLQLVSDALATYEQLSALYARENDIDGALATLGRMADLDPENIPVRIKYAEALSKAGRTDQAAQEFERGARLLREQNRVEDYVKVAERLLYHRQDDIRVARDLAELYLQRGDAKRALGKLQLCFKTDPRDVDVLQLLAHAFQLLGQTPKTISVFREIARIHQEAGRESDRELAFRRILELDPTDQEAREALGRKSGNRSPRRATGEFLPPPSAVVGSHADANRMGSPPQPGAPPASQPPPPRRPALPPAAPPPPPSAAYADVSALDDDDDDLVIVEDSLPPPPRRPSRPAPAVSGGPGAADREAQVHQLLTECEVFLRYRLYDKVVDQLHRVLELDPQHVRARVKLKDALIEAGRPRDAAEQLGILAGLVESRDPAMAGRYREEARSLEADQGADEADAVLTGLDDEAGGDDDVMFVEDESDALGGPPSAPLPGLSVVPPSSPGNGAGALPPLDSTVTHPGLAAMTPEEFEAGRAAPAPPGALASASRSERTTEIEDILDEADFYFAQALYGEAATTLEDALASFPGHRLLAEKLEEAREFHRVAASPAAAGAGGGAASLPPPLPAPPLRSSRSPAPAAATNGQGRAGVTEGSVVSDDDQVFALAAQLAEEIDQEIEAQESRPFEGSNILDVEAVFAQFKKGVAETVSAEDSDTHFDLGIAYKEMGLLDDAVSEFELSMSKPERRCLAQTMVGLCYIEKGQVAQAIDAFKRGLAAPTKTEAEELGLLFELGAAHELLEDVDEALFYFEKVRRRDPSFREVSARIDRLTSPRTQSTGSTAAPEPTMDDVDRAFDELIGGGD